MIINGREYRFNRILKIEFLKSGGKVDYTVEFNPLKKRELCARIDVDILGLPQPVKTNSPGFSASVIFYNPSPELLSNIAQQNKFVHDYVDEKPKSDADELDMSAPQSDGDMPDDQMIYLSDLQTSTSKETVANIDQTLKKFYKNRYQVRVLAGYYDPQTQTEHYSHLFTGYLNGSAFWHQGTDNILQVNCHDIDLSNIEPGTILTSLSKEARQAIESQQKALWTQKRQGKKTFDDTVRNYIQWFAPQEVRDGKIYKREDGEEKLKNFDVWYVKSQNQVRTGLKNTGTFDKSWEYPQLKLLMTSTRSKQPRAPDMSEFYSLKASLREMLSDACAAVFLNKKSGEAIKIGWDLIEDNVSKSTYIFYPLGNDPKTVPAKNATHRIWNYQNLLEAPSIDGSGCLTIKMMLRPEIKTQDSIALMLSNDLGAEEGLVPVASFDSSIHYGTNRMLGTLSSTANLRTTPTVQLSEAASVSSLRKKTKDAVYGGYMFNYGFVIKRYEHRLSTHNSDWSTEVKTVPMYGGTKA